MSSTAEGDGALRAAVLAAEGRLRRAVLDGDREAAAAVLSDAFAATGHVGNPVGKQAYLDVHFDQTRRFTRFETSGQEVALVAGAVLVTGRVEMWNANATEHPGPARYTAVYEPAGDGWRLRAWQETRIDESARF